MPAHPRFLKPGVLTVMQALLIPLQPAVLTAIPYHPRFLQQAELIVMQNHSHSPPAGRADSYTGPSSHISTGCANRYA